MVENRSLKPNFLKSERLAGFTLEKPPYENSWDALILTDRFNPEIIEKRKGICK
ncbi:hypothetical protein CHCC15291_3613 [Bacillus licheniformis]|nr:hypothetical protein CHCC20344_1863 [Bacillus licheniformis]TWL93839.1 hypothetical protein CHCC15291_3613 [Bacillus licheniformis]TWO12099.1 hypothetical protein CHCC14431_4307 [Bacillus licheniformis]